MINESRREKQDEPDNLPRFAPAQSAARIIPFPNRCLKALIMPAIVNWRNITTPAGYKPGDKFLSAHITGDSLAGDGILDGEFVIVRLTGDPEQFTESCLVAAMTPDGLLMKHVHFESSGLIRLASSNSEYDDLFYRREEIHLLGIAVRHEWDTPEGQTIEVDLSPDGRAQA